MQTKRQKGGLCDNQLEVTAWFVRTGELFRRPILEILTLMLENLPIAKGRSRTQAKRQQQWLSTHFKIHTENGKILVIKDFSSTVT